MSVPPRFTSSRNSPATALRSGRPAVAGEASLGTASADPVRIAAAGIALLTLLAAGCTGTPRDLTPSFVEAWGCDYERVQQRYNEISVKRISRAARYGSRSEEAKAERGPAPGLDEPEPGWSACRVLERNGRPNESGIEEAAAGRWASWKYVVRDLYDRVQAVHVLRLSPGEANEEADWVVREVEW